MKNSNVIAFPTAAAQKSQMILSEYDGESAVLKIQYDHVIAAIGMYLSTLPFALPDGVEVMDVDMGVEVDDEGYVTMDLYFGEEK